MRLGFDATALNSAGKGVARFQLEFLRAADSTGLIEELDIFVPEEPSDERPSRDGWRYHRVPTRPMVRWEQFGRPSLARRLGLNVVITLSERASLWGPPEVVYIYEHPKYRARRSKEVGVSLRQRVVDLTTLAQFRLTRSRAAVLIAASQSTAHDIGARTVVYSGVSRDFTPSMAKREYFLHVASDDPRDNSETVIDACAEYGPGAPRLIVAGPITRGLPALRARAERKNVSVEWRGFQTTQGLVELYRGALAYVDPSLYEGFGLQAAEALACGTPVIASNRTSLPEVVGDAGILLDPMDVAGFAAGMRRIAEDTAFAADLSRKAVVQAARFTWESTVRGILAACDTALARQSAG